MQVVPVTGEGQASRTNQARASSVGPGSASPLRRSSAAERHQPVAPVPVETSSPDDACRSGSPPGARSRYRAVWWVGCPR
ncbi:unannotated protein [freshwater metagenome]|uniref:Unannotated protein n=1 Tax=freshwater metagenome TaxID=449393 RepID=A0A6J7IU19_9ZZZZ